MMLEILYFSWSWTIGLLAVLPLASLYLPILKKYFNESKEISIKEFYLSFFATVLFTVGILFCLGSLYVHNQFVRVPALRDKTVGAAIQELQMVGLGVALPNGITLDDDIMNNPVNGQAESPGIIVKKGTIVTLYFRSEDLNILHDYYEVPSVVGKTYEEAIRLIMHRQLEYHVDGEAEPRDSSIITFQSYFPGSMVKSGTVITLKCSGGTDVDASFVPDGYVVVPAVIDLEEDVAVQLLESTGLNAKIWWFSSLNEDLNTYYIVEQSIPYGSIVPQGTEVEIQRSCIKNGTLVIVPNVIGLNSDEAASKLINCGLSFELWWLEDTENTSGKKRIIHQSIPEGSIVAAGTTISIQGE